jgi:hypothetical protein
MRIFVQYIAPSRKVSTLSHPACSSSPAKFDVCPQESSARPTSRERQATADRSCDHGASDDRPWTATREAPPRGPRRSPRRRPSPASDHPTASTRFGELRHRAG